MRRETLLNLAFILLLVALPLISLGAVQETPLIWGIGLALLLAGFLIPLLLRFAPIRSDPKDEPDVGEEPT